MSKKMDKAETRGHEHRVTIDAPPAAVWEAITRADELASWFPMEAQVEPGVGGSIKYGWTPEMQNPCQIEIWEPGSHLRTSWMEPVTAEAGSTGLPSVVDWYLEGDGGRTTLRLVHSGFGTSSKWDEEYDGTNRGWEYELRSLCHYVKHHKGTPRRMIAVRQASDLPPAEIWNRLMGPEGLAAVDGGKTLAEGSSYAFKTPTGDAFTGEVILANSPLSFAGTATNMNNALFRYAYETCFGRPEAFLFISTWGVDEAENKKMEANLQSMLKSLL